MNRIKSMGNASQVTTEVRRLTSVTNEDPILANFEMASLVESQQSMATSDLDFERNNNAQNASMAPIPEAKDEDLRQSFTNQNQLEVKRMQSSASEKTFGKASYEQIPMGNNLSKVTSQQI